MLSGIVEKVTFVEHLAEELDHCLITIDFDELHIFGNYNEILTYQGEAVVYRTGKDVWNGQPITRVVNYYIKKVIHTIDKAERVRLIPEDASTRDYCNFSSQAMRRGDTEFGVVALLSSYTKGASGKATWLDLVMIDKDAKQFNVKFFTNRAKLTMDVDEAADELVGHYVKFDVFYSAYGMQTNEVELLTAEVVNPPEVEVAISQIEQFVSGDEELREFMESTHYIEKLTDIIKGERGYHLVELASELYTIEALCNISCEYDSKLLIRAAVASRAYLLGSKTQFSESMLNINKILASPMRGDKELLLILDPMAREESTPSKEMFYRVKRFVKSIINDRRGVSNEEEEEELAKQARKYIRYM